MKLTSKILERAYEDRRKILLENEAKTVCMEYGIPVTKFKLTKNETEAVEA